MLLFKAKTQEAYVLKILSELLAHNIKTGCFEVDENGITLVMMDHHRKVLIDLNLQSKNFASYKFNSPEKIYLGINLTHFYKLLRCIKKKDNIEISIDSDLPNDLYIKVTPKENNRTTTSVIKIQNIQNLDISLPTGYKKPIIIASNEFSKMLKELGTLGTNIQISSKNGQIEFACDSGGILKKKVEFGEADYDELTEEYSEEFSSELFCRITKLANLSPSQIQVFPGKPLLLSTNIGILGKINIFIKSKSEQINNELSESSDSD
jgi:proliferating cell nuclear antigen PCNA